MRTKASWTRICNDYKNKFMALMDFSDRDGDWWWVGDIVGGTLCLNAGEFFIDLLDMKFILENDITQDEVWEWYSYISDSWMYDAPHINIKSWVKGAPRLTDEAKTTILKNKSKWYYKLVKKMISLLEAYERWLRKRNVRKPCVPDIFGNVG